jgi:hypothetical protein
MTDAPAPTRRRLLAASAAGLLGATAGCANLQHRLGDDGEPPTDEQSLRRLPEMATYVADGVDLSVPSALTVVDDASDAEVIVLPGDTDVAAARAVDWLVDDRYVALYGDAAEATWLAWTDSDAYADAFGPEGAADADPDPQLVVAGTSGGRATTHRKTWGDPPDDEAVFLAVDEAVVTISRAD